MEGEKLSAKCHVWHAPILHSSPELCILLIPCQQLFLPIIKMQGIVFSQGYPRMFFFCDELIACSALTCCHAAKDNEPLSLAH